MSVTGRASQEYWDPRIDIAAEGVPGAGKTTWLLDRLREEFADGTPLSAVVLTTYRRPMAEDLRERVEADVTGTELPDAHNVRTTHAICYRILDVHSDDVVDEDDEADFCESISVPYSLGGDAVGNKLFDLRSFCIQTFLDPYDGWRDDSVDLDEDIQRRIIESGASLPRFFNERYEEYKDENGLVDFDDMLQRVYENGLLPAGMDVLMEDEFQDKTPLQVAIHDQWAKAADRVYVAGDVFQALYGFMGTSPTFMQRALDEADESVVLEKSWRFGPSLWNPTKQVLERVGYDVPEIEPVGETSVDRIPLAAYEDYATRHRDDDALHLIRANYLAQEVAPVLNRAGIIYRSIDTGWGWTPARIDLYNAIVTTRDVIEENVDAFGYPDYSALTLPELGRVLPALPASGAANVFRDSVTKTDAVDRLAEAERRSDFELTDWVDERALYRTLTEPDTPFERLPASSLGGAEYVERMAEAYRMTDGRDIEAVDHVVSSIHGAKGREATTVFLHDKTTRKIVRDGDEYAEARVWYVGMSRAIDQLYVVTYPSGPRYDLPV